MTFGEAVSLFFSWSLAKSLGKRGSIAAAAGLRSNVTDLIGITVLAHASLPLTRATQGRMPDAGVSVKRKTVQRHGFPHNILSNRNKTLHRMTEPHDLRATLEQRHTAQSC